MKIKRIEHIAIAVDDVTRVLATLKRVLGLELEYVEHLPEHRTKLAMIPVGETYLELLEATSADSGTAQWIAQRGTGLWHLCFEVNDIDAAVQELKTRNVRLLSEGPLIGHGGSQIVFIDPSETDGLVFELVELPNGGAGGA